MMRDIRRCNLRLMRVTFGISQLVRVSYAAAGSAMQEAGTETQAGREWRVVGGWLIGPKRQYNRR